MKRKEILAVLRQHRAKEKIRLRKFLTLFKDGQVDPGVLELKGFKRYDSYKDAWIHKQKRVVIKSPHCIVYQGIPELSIPTIKVGEWWIQSLADTRKACIASVNLCSFSTRSVGDDLGATNCGYWKGVPVVFDW